MKIQIFLLLFLCLTLIPFADAETIWANTVVAYYGTNAGSGISNILGAPNGTLTDVGTADGAIWNNYVTVSFGSVFYDGPGYDLEVYVHDLDTSEDFYVYISQNNINWYQVGFTSTGTENIFPSGGAYKYDMAISGLSSAYYVKIVTNEQDAAYYSPDMDAVGVYFIPEPCTVMLAIIGFLFFATKFRIKK